MPRYRGWPRALFTCPIGQTTQGSSRLCHSRAPRPAPRSLRDDCQSNAGLVVEGPQGNAQARPPRGEKARESTTAAPIARRPLDAIDAK